MKHKTLAEFEAGVAMASGAGSGRVLTSDASGNGSWQPIVAGAGALITGTGAPTAGLGSDGAMYLDIATGEFIGPKAAGAWPSTPVGILVRNATTYDQLARGI